MSSIEIKSKSSAIQQTEFHFACIKKYRAVGVYSINAARYVIGEEPVEATAILHQHPDDARFREVPEIVAFILRYYEIHLKRVIEDFQAYCEEMGLLPDCRKWLRIVPCGDTIKLNEKWNVYYQPNSRHEYIGIYNSKAVRFIGRTVAIFDSVGDGRGETQLELIEGADKPEFRTRIGRMIAETKETVGWDVSTDTRFFCVDEFSPTLFKKTSPGGIQGPRFWDISRFANQTNSNSELADCLRSEKWE